MAQQNAAQYSYRLIVFALKHGSTFDTCLQAKKLLSYRSVLISEHPPSNDPDCEWNELHYHGIVEHNAVYRFDGDRVFNQFKSECCAWFKSEQCKLPVNFIAYMQMPPRRIIHRNLRNDESDLPLLEAQVTPELISEVRERKNQRISAKKQGSNDIQYLRKLIMECNAQSESELLNFYHTDPKFEDVYCKRTYSQNFRKAQSFCHQSVLDMPIRDLCNNFKDVRNECLTPKASFKIMQKWCEFQGIDPLEFVESIIAVFDRRNRKMNTLYLQGSPNSGKTFIWQSIKKACRYVGEISQGTSGYAFMFQDCINRRGININEPVIDYCIIELLKQVLEGVGCFVHVKNRGDEYLRPTPIMITANGWIWNLAPGAKEAILARIFKIWSNLKPAPFLKNVKKDLHPMWIPLFLIEYARAAPVVSDFSDDECISQDIDTVDLARTLKKVIGKEDLSIDSTKFAEPTTSTYHPTQEFLKNSQTRNLVQAPLKQVFSETPSPVQSTSTASLDEFPYSDILPLDLSNRPHNQEELLVRENLNCKKRQRSNSPPIQNSQRSQELFNSDSEDQIPPTPPCKIVKVQLKRRERRKKQEDPEEEDKSPL